MSKKNFHLLLKRYREGNCTSREKKLVEQWFNLLDTTGTHEKEANLDEKMWSAIQLKTKPVRRIEWWKYASAAVILLALGVSFLFPIWNNGDTDLAILENAKENFIKQTNTTTATVDAVLPDGSQITLEPGASIEYAPNFEGETREVYLNGKAFFNVKHNPEKPFLVYANKVVTKVLGTSFWIDDKSVTQGVEVSVVTGKVLVSTESDKKNKNLERVKNGVLLTANQKVTYNEKSKIFETGLVESPILIAEEDKKTTNLAPSFFYEENSISEVLSDLEKAYGIDILVENNALKKCFFRGDIGQQPLYTKLDLICSSINATYEVRGTRILISGKGCSMSNLKPIYMIR